MHKGKYVFSQLLDFLDRNDFNYLSRKYGGDKYVKQFTCYNQLCVLMFGQLSNRESLRDVVLATQAHASKAYHLGFGKHAAKSTLADANTKRDYRIFEEFAYKIIAEAQQCRIAYCMMAIVQKKMNIERSIYEMLQIVSISLTDTTNLKDLFAKPNYNIVNELDGSTEQCLFDY